MAKIRTTDFANNTFAILVEGDMKYKHDKALYELIDLYIDHQPKCCNCANMLKEDWYGAFECKIHGKIYPIKDEYAEFFEFHGDAKGCEHYKPIESEETTTAEETNIEVLRSRCIYYEIQFKKLSKLIKELKDELPEDIM